MTTLPSDTPILPNVGAIPRAPDGHYLVQEVTWHDFERFATKLVRGISFLATTTVLPPEFVVRIIEPDVYSSLSQSFTEISATIYERGASFRADRYAFADSAYGGLFRILIWQRYEFFAVIWRAELDNKYEAQFS